MFIVVFLFCRCLPSRSALFVQQMTQEGSVLQCQGQLTKKIAFKPSNVLSKAHRTLTLAVRKRAVKGVRIKKYAETIDPEQVRLLLKNILIFIILFLLCFLSFIVFTIFFRSTIPFFLHGSCVLHVSRACYICVFPYIFLRLVCFFCILLCFLCLSYFILFYVSSFMLSYFSLFWCLN